MKKLLIPVLASGLILGACGSDEAAPKEVNSGATTDTENTEKETVNVSADLMKFYMSIPNAINAVDADLNAYEASLAEGGDESLKEAAITSAENTSAAVEGLEVPETLTEKEETLTASLTKLKEVYDAKATAIAEGDTAKIEETNTQFQAVDEEFNAVLEEAGLIPSSIYNEVTK